MARAPLIALMSADDICHPDRIKIQVEEIEKYLAGVTFCRPALLDDDGMSLPDHRWPIFFKRSFASQEDLYRILFDKGNFICATSVMFRSQLIEQFGYLHHGLIQLQDLLLWAQWLPHTRFHCSEHRYLFYRIRDGDGNLSSKINQWRTNFEKRIVYSNFFIGVNRSFLAKIFDDQISLESSDVVFEAQKAKLLLAHRDPIIKKLGAEKLVDLLRTKENSDVLDVELGIRVRDLYQQIGNIIDARRSQPLERRFSLKSLRGKFRSQK